MHCFDANFPFRFYKIDLKFSKILLRDCNVMYYAFATPVQHKIRVSWLNKKTFVITQRTKFDQYRFQQSHDFFLDPIVCHFRNPFIMVMCINTHLFFYLNRRAPTTLTIFTSPLTWITVPLLVMLTNEWPTKFQEKMPFWHQMQFSQKSHAAFF